MQTVKQIRVMYRDVEDKRIELQERNLYIVVYFENGMELYGELLDRKEFIKRNPLVEDLIYRHDDRDEPDRDYIAKEIKS